MAGPLSGIGGQPQVFQASQIQNTNQNNQGVRQQNDEQRQARDTNEVQPQNAPVNNVQDTTQNAQNLNDLSQDPVFAANESEAQVDPNAPRGSLIDIAV